MPTSNQSILIISGWDSSGGAGMLVDITTTQALGLSSCGVITAVTAQSNRQVIDIKSINPDLFRSQLLTTLENQPSVCKIGMLASIQQVEIVAQLLPEQLPIIIDPVMVSSSGTCLVQNDVICAIQELLFSRSLLVTPNQDELFQMAQTKPQKLNTDEAIQLLFARGCKNILLKGGHIDSQQLTDSLFEQPIDNGSDKTQTTRHFQHPRQPGSYRGTGCLLATAIACQIALGQQNLGDACQAAIHYLQKQLANTPSNGEHTVKILQ